MGPEVEPSAAEDDVEEAFAAGEIGQWEGEAVPPQPVEDLEAELNRAFENGDIRED